MSWRARKRRRRLSHSATARVAIDRVSGKIWGRVRPSLPRRWRDDPQTGELAARALECRDRVAGDARHHLEEDCALAEIDAQEPTARRGERITGTSGDHCTAARRAATRCAIMSAAGRRSAMLFSAPALAYRPAQPELLRPAGRSRCQRADSAHHGNRSPRRPGISRWRPASTSAEAGR